MDSQLLIGFMAGALATVVSCHFYYTRLANKTEVIVEQAKSLRPTEDGNHNNSDDDEQGGDSSHSIFEQMKMIFVVNESLKMGKGKVAAQCCHACLGSYKKASPDAVRTWSYQGQAKIAVKANDERDLQRVYAEAKKAGLPCYLVADAGRTQIAAGSITVCGIGPAPVSKIDPITREFKLL